MFITFFLNKLAEMCVLGSFHLSCFLYVTLREKTCGITLIPWRGPLPAPLRPRQEEAAEEVRE